MEKLPILPSILIISEGPYYPLLFRHAVGDAFQVISILAHEFSFPMIKDLSPEAIILDETFYKNSIFALCREFRSRSQFALVPIAVITNNLKIAHTDLLIKAGASQFLRDPFEEEDVFLLLEKMKHYREIQKKVVTVTETLAPPLKEDKDFSHRIILDKKAFTLAEKAIEMGKPLVVLFLSVDQENLTDPRADQIANYIKSELGPNDLFLPLAKGKYLIILMNAAQKAGFLLAEKIKKELASSQLTLSIGMASQKSPPYATFGQILFDANLALKEAKEEGDQIIIHREKPHGT